MSRKHFAVFFAVVGDASPYLVFPLRYLSANEIMSKQTSECQFVRHVDWHNFFKSDTARTSQVSIISVDKWTVLSNEKCVALVTANNCYHFVAISHNHKMENSTREHVDCDHIENVSSTVAKVQKFLQDGCRYHGGLKGDQCSDYLKAETVISNLYDCLELSHAELDLVILPNLQAFTAAEVTGGKRKRIPAYSFLYQSRPICKEMFLHVYGISKSRFQRLLEHYQNHGISLQVHGNSKRLPHNTLPQSIAEDVKNFLSNYAEENAITLTNMLYYFLGESLVLKTRTLCYFRRVRPKCTSGTALKELVRWPARESRVTRNLSSYGNNSIQTS